MMCRLMQAAIRERVVGDVVALRRICATRPVLFTASSAKAVGVTPAAEQKDRIASRPVP